MFKKVLLALVAGLGLIFVIGLWFLQSSLFADYMRERLVAFAAERQAALTLRNLSFQFIGARVDSASIFLPRSLLQLEVGNLDVRVRGWFSPWLTAHTEAYGGTVNASIRPRADQQLELSLQTNKLNLPLHPALSYFGIRAGTVDLDIPSMWVRSGHLETLDGRLTIQGLHILARTLTPETTGMPLPLSLPEIRQGNITARCKIARGELICGEVLLSSHEMEASISLDFLQLSKDPTLQLDGRLSLQGKWHELIVPALVVGCSQQGVRCETTPSMQHRTFTFSLSGRTQKPVFTLRTAS